MIPRVIDTTIFIFEDNLDEALKTLDHEFIEDL